MFFKRFLFKLALPHLQRIEQLIPLLNLILICLFILSLTDANSPQRSNYTLTAILTHKIPKILAF